MRVIASSSSSMYTCVRLVPVMLLKGTHSQRARQKKRKKKREANVRCSATNALIIIMLMMALMFFNGTRETSSPSSVVVVFGVVIIATHINVGKYSTVKRTFCVAVYFLPRFFRFSSSSFHFFFFAFSFCCFALLCVVPKVMQKI